MAIKLEAVGGPLDGEMVPLPLRDDTPATVIRKFRFVDRVPHPSGIAGEPPVIRGQYSIQTVRGRAVLQWESAP